VRERCWGMEAREASVRRQAGCEGQCGVRVWRAVVVAAVNGRHEPDGG